MLRGKRPVSLLSVLLLSSLALALMLVTFTAQAGDVCTVPSAAHPTIQSAVNDAGCDTVNVAAGIFTENVIINRSVIVQGEGPTVTTVNGNGAGTVFTIQPDAVVTLAEMSIVNGQGGVRNRGSRVTIRASHILSNTSSNVGGVYNHVGDDFDITSIITVTDSLIAGNTVTGAVGAGLRNDGTATVLNSVFLDNQAIGGEGNGGAISNGGSYTGSLHINNSQFHNNVAAWKGGAIYNDIDSLGPHPVTIVNSIIAGNSAQLGGGLYSWEGIVVIDSSEIISNAVSGLGGGIFLYESSGTLSVSNSRIVHNSSTEGGGIWNGGMMEVISSIIGENHASSPYVPTGGGGIYNNRTSIIEASTISSNTASLGGGIFNQTGEVTLINSTLSGNTAEDEGGAIDNADFSFGVAELTIRNSTLVDNIAGSQGSSIHAWASEGADVTLVNSIIASSSTVANCSGNGAFISLGYNIASDSSCSLTATGDMPDTDPLLGPLADNGGPTPTHAPLPGSPAIDAGNPDPPGSSDSACQPTDQRGVSRPYGAYCDIGAYEYVPTMATLDSQYLLSNGESSALTHWLLANGSFLDDEGGLGAWQQAGGEWLLLEYEPDAFCGAQWLGRRISATTVRGRLRCQDGSEVTGYWQGQVP